MGRVDTLRNEIARLQKAEADLRKDVSKAEGVAASARTSPHNGGSMGTGGH